MKEFLYEQGLGSDNRGEYARRFQNEPLVVSKDQAIIDAIMAASAANGSDPRFIREVSEARRWWARASKVIVGADVAAEVIALGLSPRTNIYLTVRDAGNAAQWSAPLNATVLVIPEQTGYLSAILSEKGSLTEGAGNVMQIMGGSGGVGGSTLAAAITQRAAMKSVSSVLVDMDPYGGGIDLLFSAEREEGWRWPDLSSASGVINDVAGRLPHVNGFPVLSMGHSFGESLEKPVGLPEPSAVKAVLDCLIRTHELVVLDDPQAHDFSETGKIFRLILVAAEVRAVMAARARIQHFDWQDAQVVVRTGPGMSINPHSVAHSLGLPLVGQIGFDKQLTTANQVGDLPGRASGRPYSKQVDALLERLVGVSQVNAGGGKRAKR